MIDITIQAQPDDESCGPTSLHAIYRYYGLDILLTDLMQTIGKTVSGGTLASTLGQDAQKRGFHTRLYVNNVDIFDPTWFTVDGTTKKQYLQ